MSEQIESSKRVLEDYLLLKKSCPDAPPDRKEVVAYATLSAFTHHWPSRSNAQLSALLEATASIKAVERSRYFVQRRIAIAKIAREMVL
jgi:hypothetical protein